MKFCVDLLVLYGGDFYGCGDRVWVCGGGVVIGRDTYICL